MQGDAFERQLEAAIDNAKAGLADFQILRLGPRCRECGDLEGYGRDCVRCEQMQDDARGYEEPNRELSLDQEEGVD